MTVGGLPSAEMSIAEARKALWVMVGFLAPYRSDRMRRLLLGLAAALALTACSHQPDTPASPVHYSQPSTDKQAIAEEFPNLKGIKDVYWIEGNNSDPSPRAAPGPSTFYLESMIYLDETGTEEITAFPYIWDHPAPTWTQKTHPTLTPKIENPTTWLHSPTFDTNYASKNNHYHGTFYLNPDKTIIYYTGTTF
ncbi:hypothetical protein [Actinocrispum sp. NPDC049592]|uniref:hypothetical protein n=1 Tax=Actinocrispum sp. NPDC049592 TaxID=3154835 RepID=UPI00342E220B